MMGNKYNQPTAVSARPPGLGSERTLARIWDDPDALLREYSARPDPRIRERLVVLYGGLVRALASRFEGRGWTATEDLVQVGYLGLLSAIEGFRPERGTAFTTFAVPTIVGMIKHYLRDHTWGVKVPRRLRELGMSLRRQREQLAQKLRRPPTMAEMAEAVGVTEERLVQAMELERTYQPLSLDSQLESSDGDEYSRFIEATGDVDPRLRAIEDRESVRAALLHLDRRQREILYFRYYEGASQQQVATRLGISQMHVSRLERKALQDLREILQIT